MIDASSGRDKSPLHAKKGIINTRHWGSIPLQYQGQEPPNYRKVKKTLFWKLEKTRNMGGNGGKWVILGPKPPKNGLFARQCHGSGR